jgi:glycine cleavage system H protein
MSADDFPNEFKYNKDYSWTKSDDKTATVGVVASAAKKVKEFVFINLPKKGTEIKKGDTYVSVEAVKWSGHLSSPVSGKIIDVNDSLFDEPATINKDPYGSWIMKVELSDPDEIDELMDAEEAENHYEAL